MTSERLEMIRSMHENNEVVHQFDIEWLIERAETAQELELRYEMTNRLGSDPK